MKNIFILFFGLVFISTTMVVADDDVKVITLEEAIKLSIKNNFSLKKARLEVLGSGYDRTIAESYKKPNVQFELSAFVKDKPEMEGEAFTIGAPPNEMTVGPFSAFEMKHYTAQALISVTQPLYTGGQITSNIFSAKAIEENKLLLLEQTKQDLIFRTVVAYYNVIRALSSFEVEGKILTMTQKNLEDVQKKYDVKAITRYELIRAQSDVLEAESAGLVAERDYQASIIELANLLNIDPDFLTDGKLEYKEANPDVKFEITYALKNRSDLKSFSSLIDAQVGRVDAIKGEYMPQVNLHANAGVQAPEFGEMGGDDSAKEIWRVGVLVNWKLYDGSKKKNRVMAVENEQYVIKAEQQLLSERVKEEIRKTIVDLNILKKNVVISQSALEKSGEVYELVSLGYKNGSNTQLQLLDARLQVSKSYRDLVLVTFRYELSRARLVYLTGRMSESFDPKK